MQVFETQQAHGILKDLSSDTFASELIYFQKDSLEFDHDATYFGYVIDGSVTLSYADHDYPLSAGMYFSAPQSLRLSGPGKALVMSRLGYRGFFQLGGAIEEKGRLTYIDGCTDSLLIAPVMMGDPCLNLLHIPAHTEQSQHTHPSLRLGVIVSGEGICKTPDRDYQLKKGTVFYIPQDGKHSFHTKDKDLRVIAYHPDSDFGPTHENHPMVNKTIL